MIRILTLLTIWFLATGCEEKENDDIYSAQLCLNTATASNVDVCVQKIISYSSPQAFSIRCGADFIRQNITGSRIVDAVERIDENDDDSIDPMAHMMAFMTFKTEDAADIAITNCRSSQSDGMLALAIMSKMATILVVGLGLDPSGGNGVDPDTLDGLIDAANSGSLTNEEKESLGETIVLAYPLYCGTNGQFKGEEICTNLDSSIDAGSNIAIAEALLEALKDDE